MSFFDKFQANGQDQLAKEIAKGEAFLAENKKRPEVIETASGLQYEVMVEGTGPKPSGSTSKVNRSEERRVGKEC